MSEELFRPDVVAGKYDAKLFDPHGMELLVNEMFYSIQGEGSNAGRPAVFIRLAKCNLACKFCDTEFEKYERVLFSNPIDFVMREAHPKALIILTGGEPALQNCEKLVKGFRDRAHEVAIETSGSIWSPWMKHLNHICVSPKVPLKRIPGGLMMELMRRRQDFEPTGRKDFYIGARENEHRDAPAAEMKWIVNGAFMAMHNATRGQGTYLPGLPNYLQPESQKPEFTALAIHLCKQFPDRYRLSMQMHKYAEVR